MMRADRRFGDVVRVHQDLVVAVAQVKLGEVACFMELVQKFVDYWYGKLVLHHLAVKCSVVNVETSGAILLAKEEHGQKGAMLCWMPC